MSGETGFTGQMGRQGFRVVGYHTPANGAKKQPVRTPWHKPADSHEQQDAAWAEAWGIVRQMEQEEGKK